MFNIDQIVKALQTDRNAQNTAMTGAAGLAAGMLLSGGKLGKLAGNTAKLGAMAALGGLAYSAWQNHQNSRPAAPAPSSPDAFIPPAADVDAQEQLGKTLVRAMISAAKADGRIDAAAFSLSPSLPLDIAVMERTAHAAVVPTRFVWSDVGNWPSLADALEADIDGNIFTGDIEAIDCKNSYLRGEGVTLTALGVDDLIVVATGDAVFVAPRSRAHDVKKILAELKAKGPPSLL